MSNISKEIKIKRCFYDIYEHTPGLHFPHRLHWLLFVWYRSTREHPAQLMFTVPLVRFLGIFSERENWPLCSMGRSVYRKGSFRLMTRGGDSLWAFMHHVPFTAKHVRRRSHWEFLGYLRSVSITFGSERWYSATERQRETEAGQGVGVWWVEVLEPNWVTSYLGHLP